MYKDRNGTDCKMPLTIGAGKSASANLKAPSPCGSLRLHPCQPYG